MTSSTSRHQTSFKAKVALAAQHEEEEGSPAGQALPSPPQPNPQLLQQNAVAVLDGEEASENAAERDDLLSLR